MKLQVLEYHIGNGDFINENTYQVNSGDGKKRGGADAERLLARA
jgi:hypothetical protein